MSANIKQEPIELPLQESNLNIPTTEANIKELNDIIATLRTTNKKQRIKLFNLKNNYQQIEEENAELKKRLFEKNDSNFKLKELKEKIENLQIENSNLRKDLNNKIFEYKVLDGLRLVAQEEVKKLKEELEYYKINKENLMFGFSYNADAQYLSLRHEILTMEQRFCEFKKQLSDIECKNICYYNERISLAEKHSKEIDTLKEQSKIKDIAVNVKNMKLKRLQNGTKLKDI